MGETHLSSRLLHAILPLLLVVTGAVFRFGLARRLGSPLSSIGGLLVGAKGLLLVLLRWQQSGRAGAALLGGLALALIAGYYVGPTRKMARHSPLAVLGVDMFHYTFALAVVLLAAGIDAATVHNVRPMILAWIPYDFSN